jgi:hypothetical protein
MRGRHFKRNTNLNLAISTTDIDNAATAKTGGPAIEDGEHGMFLLKFVQALAKRQARLDARMPFDAANDNRPRILH